MDVSQCLGVHRLVSLPFTMLGWSDTFITVKWQLNTCSRLFDSFSNGAVFVCVTSSCWSRYNYYLATYFGRVRSSIATFHSIAIAICTNWKRMPRLAHFLLQLPISDNSMHYRYSACILFRATISITGIYDTMDEPCTQVAGCSRLLHETTLAIKSTDRPTDRPSANNFNAGSNWIC